MQDLMAFLWLLMLGVLQHLAWERAYVRKNLEAALIAAREKIEYQNQLEALNLAVLEQTLTVIESITPLIRSPHFPPEARIGVSRFVSNYRTLIARRVGEPPKGLFVVQPGVTWPFNAAGKIEL